MSSSTWKSFILKTFFNVSFLIHLTLSCVITHELWDHSEHIYFGISVAFLCCIYLIGFIFLFLFYISMATHDNNELREYTSTPCIIFTGLFVLLTCGYITPSHYNCYVLNRVETSSFILYLSFLPSIIPISIISIFTPILLCLYTYYSTDNPSMVITFQAIIISSFSILHLLIICNYFLSSISLTISFLLSISFILVYILTQINIIKHYAFKLSFCCEFILLIYYLLLYFMVQKVAFIEDTGTITPQEYIVTTSCIIYIFPVIPFLPTYCIFKYFNDNGNKLYLDFLFNNNVIDTNDTCLINKLYSIIHIATHSYSSINFKVIYKDNDHVDEINIKKPLLSISSNVYGHQEYEHINYKDNTHDDTCNKALISKHDKCTHICYEYQYDYMLLNKMNRNQYISSVIGHQSVLKRIIFWFSPSDNLFPGILIWIALNIQLFTSIYCHLFPIVWFGYIYIYNINYIDNNNTFSIQDWLFDNYHNYQHLLITIMNIIYLIFLILIIPSLINVIKQVHYTGYISRILLSGHHPPLDTVQQFYNDLNRNFLVIQLMPSVKIGFIVLDYIVTPNKDMVTERYNADFEAMEIKSII